MMKAILMVALVLTAAAQSAHAVNFTCKSFNTFSGEDYEEPNNHLFLLELGGYSCKSNHGDHYVISFYGFGPGLRFDVGNVLQVNCPLIGYGKLKRRLAAHKEMMLFGPEVDASALVGAKVGFFVNQRGGICTLTGLIAGVGASASVAAIQIEDDNQGARTQSVRQEQSSDGWFKKLVRRIFTW